MNNETTFLVVGKTGTRAAVEAARLHSAGIVRRVSLKDLHTLVEQFANQELSLVFNESTVDRCDLLDSLEKAIATIPIKIVLENVSRDGSPSQQITALLLSGEKRNLDLCNDLHALFYRVKQKFDVISKRLPPEIDVHWAKWTYISPLFKDYLYRTEQSLYDYLESEIFADSNDPSISFPVSFLKARFSSKLSYIKALYPESGIDFYRPAHAGKAKILFVFPERMLPLQRAYYVRAFDLLSSLTSHGFSVDVLIYGPNNKDLETIKKCLGNVSHTAYAYPLVRGGFTKFHRIVRQAEIFARRRLKVSGPPPIRFNERQMVFGSDSQLQNLSKLVSANEYSHLIVTGAWFVDSALAVVAERHNIKLICDLHDVFFVLDRDSNKDERRFLYSAKAQKELELKSIAKCDLALAISEADHANLSLAGMDNVITCSGSFEYAFVPVRPMCWNNVRFGFIGSGNKNNERCIDVIRRCWIKRIMEVGRDFKIIIAGSICKTEAARKLKDEFQDYVELVGFVDNIRSYYESVHIILAPIMVQGGLNFKSAEALVAGRYLITNQLGTRCLGEMNGLLVTDNDGDLIPSLLRSISFDNDVTVRSSIQKSALKKFGSLGGYASLNTFLNNTLQ